MRGREEKVKEVREVKEEEQRQVGFPASTSSSASLTSFISSTFCTSSLPSSAII